MIKETKQDWKVERIAEYAKLEAKRKAMEEHLVNNPDINKLNVEVETARLKLIEAEKPFYESINGFIQQQVGIKQELAEKWDCLPFKEYACDVGVATLRTTRSLHIRSKEKLIDFLTTINKLPDFIKTFEITKLRKIKDAGLLGDEIATWDEKKNVAIKIAEVEQ